MAKYMLDTNICIYLIKNHPPELVQRFSNMYVGDVVMSAITYAELCYGVQAACNPKREGLALKSLIDDIPVAVFDEPACLAYGPLRFATRDSKKDHLDKLIASHAIALGVTLVSNNVKDFKRYPGLVVENWLD